MKNSLRKHFRTRKQKITLLVFAGIIAASSLFYAANAATTVGTNVSTTDLTVSGNTIIGDGAADTLTLKGTTAYTMSGSNNFAITATNSTLAQSAPFLVGASSSTDQNAGVAIAYTMISGATGTQYALSLSPTKDAAAGTLYGFSIDDLSGTNGSGNEYAIYQIGAGWDYGIYTEDEVAFGATSSGGDTASSRVRVANLDSTLTTQQYLLDLAYVDDSDANGDFIRVMDDMNGSPADTLFVMAQGGDTTWTLEAGANLVVDADTTDATVDPLSIDVGTITNGVDGIEINVDANGNTGSDLDTMSGIYITMSNNTTDQATDDNVYGLSIANLGGTARDGAENAIDIQGPGWDQGLVIQNEGAYINLGAADNVDLDGQSNDHTGNYLLNVHADAAGASTAGIQIAMTQVDDSDATDTNKGLYIESTVNSNDADNYYGIFMNDPSGGQTSPYMSAMRVGSGWDTGFDMGNVNPASGSADAFDFTGTTGIMNGSDTFQVFDVNVTSANHTGAGNSVTGIDLRVDSADADASERAIYINGGWDTGLEISKDAAAKALKIDATSTDSTLDTSAEQTGIVEIAADMAQAASREQRVVYIDAEAIDDTNGNQTYYGIKLDFKTSSDDDGDITRALGISNLDAGGITDALITLENQDSTSTSVIDAIKFLGGSSASPDFGIGINFDEADFTKEIILESSEVIHNQSDGSIVLEDGDGTDYMIANATTFQINLSGQVGGTAQRVCHDGADAATGMQGLGDCGATQADLAEYFDVLDDAQAGDLVVISGEAYELTIDEGETTYAAVRKNKKTYESSAIGVISTNPSGEILGGIATAKMKNPKPVAIAGRVVVHASNENGQIRPGDMLTASSKPGYVMKATKSGRVIGMAMSRIADKQVVMQIMNTWYTPIE
ncbi:MAG: hypothetical protein AAB588_06440 [Patescibacteria group bacterium]